MTPRLPTPTRIEDVYWALLESLRPETAFHTTHVKHQLALAGYDAPTLLEAARRLQLMEYNDVRGLELRFTPARLLSVPRPAFYDAAQLQHVAVTRTGRSFPQHDDCFAEFDALPAAPGAPQPPAPAVVRYYPVSGQLDLELAMTLPELHARLLNPPPHLQALAQLLATPCPRASYAAYEALQDGIRFSRVDGPNGPTPLLLVLQLTLGDFVSWAQAWHALLSDENLETALLLLFTQASGRHLTAVVEVPGGLPLAEARCSFEQYLRLLGNGSLFEDVTVLNDLLAYVPQDDYAYLRRGVWAAPAAHPAN